MDEITFKLIRDKAELDTLIALRSSIEEVYADALATRKAQMSEAGYDPSEPGIGQSCRSYAMADTLGWVVGAIDEHIEVGIAAMQSVSETKH